ncbi:uncharacterized protein LOC117177248 [Belonocnema kinseyi]|uniref:uncharacterized protein LOC117177248 n=1 Tax=Belonocnema kinseyi TaxID=2817044 RepID=UPI00143CDAA2|nr:uncharacterized protein LOC117177248 [Belonocnema kinseyi]
MNNDGAEDVIERLRSRVECLEQELALKQKELISQNLKANTLDKQVRGLRREGIKWKEERLLLKSTICSQQKQAQLIFKDMEKLRKNLELYRNVKFLVNCAVDDIKEIFSETESRETLITYIKVMKLRTLKLQQSVMSISHERDLLSNQLHQKKSMPEMFPAAMKAKKPKLEEKSMDEKFIIDLT